MWHRRSSRTKLVSIQLLEPIIFIGQDQDTSPVVRGIIHVLLDKTMKLRNLNIHIHGTIKMQRKKDSKLVNSESQLVSEDLSLFPSPLAAMTTTNKFPFEMPLPSGIPETVKSADIQVQYVMTVSMDYTKLNQSGLQHELATQDIILARLPDNDPLRLQPIERQFLNWCKYRITIDKKTAALGSRLPVKIEINPLLTGFKLKQVFLQLMERRAVTKNNLEKTNQSCYFIYPAKNSLLMLPTKPITQFWQASGHYQLPDDKLSHSTMEYSSFKISHSVLVSLIVSVPDKGRQVTKTISYQANIDLLSPKVNQLDERECVKLPPYNCIMSGEELEKLNRYGLGAAYPPSYEESIIV